MASDAAQFAFDPVVVPPAPASGAATRAPKAGFAGFSRGQLIIGALLLLTAIWAMWTTREIVQLRAHKVVSVRLSEIVNQFALAEARSGDEPEKVTAATRMFMGALDKALKARAAEGTVVLVGEAVVSASSEDITAAVAADVARLVPMPVAQAMPPRLPITPSAVSPAAPGGGVGQAMLGVFGAGAGQGSQPQSYVAPQGGAAPVEGDPSSYQGGGDVQP